MLLHHLMEVLTIVQECNADREVGPLMLTTNNAGLKCCAKLRLDGCIRIVENEMAK